MSNIVDKVLAVALAEEGYLEKSRQAYKSNHDILDSKEDGAGSDNYTKYGRDMHKICPSVMDFPAKWCDTFVDWCFCKAYGVEQAKALLGGGFNDLTEASAQLYKNMNAWHTKDPQIGDQIFFKNKKGKICHTGLVHDVTEGYIYTIEGNTSSAWGLVSNGVCVKKKRYAITDAKIEGFGRPNYDSLGDHGITTEIPETDTWRDLVMELQKALNADFDAQLVVDGIAGPKTLNATPTLNARIRSSRPKAVKALQKLLTYWGYKCLVDGDFYTATEKMTKLFQSEQVGMKKTDGEFTAKKESWKVLLKLK